MTLGDGDYRQTINLGAGTDSLTLASHSANTVTCHNVETITGGSQRDVFTVRPRP